jgi:2-methylisocitrate lyase-like PEP mutase family enzyme
MCIEDKLFPKTNSFIDGEQQALVDPHEFAGKIKAENTYLTHSEKHAPEISNLGAKAPFTKN